ncbi:hypothetical protein JTE90_013713 [Oedothorax gibbosus]|uniref:Uncharacterized protein n=1 Tax=Oedothorax gibbosus TaxID=931172 RepID=A0AAV6UYD5_9ARAC|nr:hypothetical protein JTE90_013713 [Oedothorax gibbosus]
MKLIALCLLFAVKLACCQIKELRCHKTADCEVGQCCVARSIFGFDRGDCKYFSKIGQNCSSESLFSIDQYFLHCPCEQELSCEPTEIKELPMIGTIKIDERCVEGTTTVLPVPNQIFQKTKNF